MAKQPYISQTPVCDAVGRIGDADHCQAGGAIGLSAALAAALAQATANATLQESPTPEQAAAACHMQTLMSQTRSEFLRIADQDANAILEFVAMEERGEVMLGYQLLCDGPRDLAVLAMAAAQAMETFRAYVCPRARDDLEFALTLMTGAARGAMQLLDSNLRIWPLPELLAQYDPQVTQLLNELAALQPATRIRS